MGTLRLEQLKETLGNDSWLTVLLLPVPITYLRPQTLLVHQAINPLLATVLAQITQIICNLAIPIEVAAFQPELLGRKSV